MLGFLLARSGVDVTVLEKHGDFLRDFRGDTIHPTTMDVMAELGLLDEFLELPHTRLEQASLGMGERTFPLADFRHLPTRCRFLALMPQWDFLDFITSKAERFPSFHLEMNTEAVDLLWEGGRVTGVRATTGGREIEILADLVVSAEGRDSVLRRVAGLDPDRYGVPFDVLWFRLPRRAGMEATLGRIGPGQLLITLDRGNYWQCGLVIEKGSFDEVRAEGLGAFRERIAAAAPSLGSVVGELTDWDQIKLLSVQVDRLRRWHRPGFLCIGDAAHAMSPAGGVGVNYAIADAVAAANALALKLRDRRVAEADLRSVQERRFWPVRLMQRIQVSQGRLVGRVVTGASVEKVIPVLSALPPVRRLIGRLIGLGFRREHVRTPELPIARR